MTARGRTTRLRLRQRGEAGGRAQRGTWGGVGLGRDVGVTGESGHCPGTRTHLSTEGQRAHVCILETLLCLLFREPVSAEQVYRDPGNVRYLQDPDLQPQKRGGECAPCRQRVLRQV